MLNIPLLKFEKTTTYLNNQLEIQENNKQLIMDIIANIGLILNTSPEDKKENFETLLNSSNEFLQKILNNITTINQLNIEISNIANELTNVFSENNKTSKTKEFYIASLANIQPNIAAYIKKFQALERKLDNDNKNFNEFIDINNFKYTFETIENSDKESNSNIYEFTGFSINNEEFSSKNSILEDDSITLEEVVQDEDESNFTKEISISEENIEETPEADTENITNNENQKIDEITNEFKELLKGISNGNNEIKDVFDFVETSLKAEFSENELPEKNLENNSSNDVEIENNSLNFLNLTDEQPETQNEETNIEINLSSNLVSKNIDIYDDIGIEDTPKDVYVSSNTENIIYEKEKEKEEKIEEAKTIVKPMRTDSIDYFDDIDFSKINTINTSYKKSTENYILEDTGDAFEQYKEKNIASAKNINSTNLDINIDDLNEEELTSLIAEDSFFETNSDGFLIGKNDKENVFDKDENYDLKYEEEENEKYDDESDKDLSSENKTSIASNDENLSISEKIDKIKAATYDNETLIISENTNKVYLPYKISELVKYVESYPDVYTSLSDVVEQEFILPFDYFTKHPYKVRFFETFNLIRNRAGYSVFTALRFSIKLLYKSNLNPAIIAACKTQTELKSLIYHLDNDNLQEFKYFKIIFDVNPLKQ